MTEPPDGNAPPLIGGPATLLREAAAHFNNRAYRAAATICLQLLDANPDLGAAWHILGRIGVETSDFTNAIANLARAVSLEPDNTTIRFSLAQALDKAGQTDRAIAAWRAYATLAPDDASAPMRIATALHRKDDFEGAVEFYDKVLTLNDADAACHNALSAALRGAGAPLRALHHGRRAVALEPASSQFQKTLATALLFAGRTAEGAKKFEIMRAQDPADAEILNNLGVAYMDLNRPDMAVRRLEQSIALRDDWAEPHHNIANALRQAGRLDHAEIHFQRALAINPRDFKIHGSRAVMLMSDNRPLEAAESYRQALSLAPEEAELHKGLGIAKLMVGDLSEGWRNYEYRWECAGFQKRDFGGRRWRGEPIEGARLLIHAEQGFGDTLQFCRYITMAQERANASHIIVEIQPALLRLMQCVENEFCTLIARGDTPPTADYDIPMMSLPAVFDTTLETIPSTTPYLSIPAALRNRWAPRIKGDADGATVKKIGFVWAGNPNRQDDGLRSCPFSEFKRIFDHPDVTFYSLQLESPPGQLPQTSNIIDLSSEISDFADTGAIIDAMDLIITVDTATAHLAGALGAPVWVLLGYAADWRYLMDRTDSPWYPSMRLFRQPAQGDWRAVVSDILSALKTDRPNNEADRTTPQDDRSGELA